MNTARRRDEAKRRGRFREESFDETQFSSLCHDRDRQDRDRGTDSKTASHQSSPRESGLVSWPRLAAAPYSCCLISLELIVGSIQCQFQRAPEWTDFSTRPRALSASIS